MLLLLLLLLLPPLPPPPLPLLLLLPPLPPPPLPLPLLPHLLLPIHANTATLACINAVCIQCLARVDVPARVEVAPVACHQR